MPFSGRFVFPVVLIVGLFLAGCDAESILPEPLLPAEPEQLAQLAVSLRPGDDRAVLLGNQQGMFFYDALAGPRTDNAMGFIAGGFRLLDEWNWWFPEDSLGLEPASRRYAAVRPDVAVRTYLQADTMGMLPRVISQLQGIRPKRLREMIYLTDRALVIDIPDSLGIIDLLPSLSDRPADGYEVMTLGSILLISRSNYPAAVTDDPRPVWLAIASDDGQAIRGNVNLLDRFPQSAGTRERATAPGRLRIDTPASVVMSYGNTPEEAAARAGHALSTKEVGLQRQQQRLAVIAGNLLIHTENEDFNRTVIWSRIMLEQLVQVDSARTYLHTGIAGSDAAYGWNPLSAVEGAFLVTGQWERAADMLRLYARNQRFDQRIDIFGRAPTRFDVRNRPVYQTADAAAILTAVLGDYLRITGDNNLVLGERRLFWTNPVYAQRGYADPNQLRTPAGFIRNRNGETWPQPPGNYPGEPIRAPESVEVQSWFYESLLTMERLATIMGVRAQANAYRDSANVFSRRFRQSFVDNGRMADYRSTAGRSDFTPRLSVLTALRMLDLDDDTRRTVLRRLAEVLLYDHGIASRTQQDSLFYPYLTHEGFLDPELARYEGGVWTAFSGSVISLATDLGAHNLAESQHRALQDYVTKRGIIGAIPENVAAHPRRSDELPEIGGAAIQPWSLAEFIRTSVQDMAGIRYLSGRELVIQPNLPEFWGSTQVRQRLGDGYVDIRLNQSSREVGVTILSQGSIPSNATATVRAFGREYEATITDSLTVVVQSGSLTLNGDPVEATGSYVIPDASFWNDFRTVQPEIRDEYPVMRQLQEERRLSLEQVTRFNYAATRLIAQTDPVGDDWGRTATFTYPTDYPRGILDATYLEIAEDVDAYYFTIEFAAAESPATFGRMPIFLAIALNTGEGGARTVGLGAQFSFDANAAYNTIIFLGDGLRVEDHQGRVMGEIANVGPAALDVSQARIRFAVPRFVLPSIPARSQITLLVGVNEGGNPGRFRAVQTLASAQYGGGKTNPSDANVYDVITARR